ISLKTNMESEIIPETPENSSDESTPPEILKKADEVINNLVPQVSRPKYVAAYNKFMEWRRNKKQQNKGFKPNKAETLDAEQVNQFLNQAPDNQFLAIKVALIFGVQGACRHQELCDLTVDNIIDKGDMLLVKIPKTKTGKARSFVVTDEFYQTYKKYFSSRPTNLATKRFFVGYRNGRCTKQNIGINTFGSMPKIVAKYLNLANPESYTGHTFRRTSATLLADSGADLLTKKRHGGWKSNSVAEGYVEGRLSR
ncbi:jg23352, partial [Pararge aegeria aegeria]